METTYTYCRICGTWDNVEYRPSKRQFLCESCNSSTPRKVSRSAFDAVYWAGEGEQPPEPIKREFYSDYLASEASLEQYIEQTTSSF